MERDSATTRFGAFRKDASVPSANELSPAKTQPVNGSEARRTTAVIMLIIVIVCLNLLFIDFLSSRQNINKHL